MPTSSDGPRALEEEQSGVAASELEDEGMNQTLETGSSWEGKQTDSCLLKNDRASIEASTQEHDFVFVFLAMGS